MAELSGSSAVDGNVLEGVSATTLWTLHNRASEAKRSDGVIRDPWAITLFDAISYDYLKFGRPNQSHALRAVAFDAAVRDYLTTHPKASVVALAEGLQTSFWRLRRSGGIESRWYSIDLPPVIALREQLLPHEDQIRSLAQSALDRSWMDEVDDADGVFITAEGLLMYLEPDDAIGLITDCAARFPGGQMMFDSVPKWFSRRTVQGRLKLSDRYLAPAMPFGLSPDEAVALGSRIPGVHAAYDVPMPPGRGLFRLLASPAWDRIGFLRSGRPSFTLLEFAR